MNKTVGIIVGLIVAALAIFGVMAATRNKTEPTQPSTSNTATTPPSNDTGTTPPSDETSATTITFTSSGFSPASIKVKAGTTVTFVNDSSQPIEVASDEHPSHTNNPELNVGSIAPGKSATVTLTSQGNWGYHDHLNPSVGGIIIVE